MPLATLRSPKSPALNAFFHYCMEFHDETVIQLAPFITTTVRDTGPLASGINEYLELQLRFHKTDSSIDLINKFLEIAKNFEWEEKKGLIEITISENEE